jgi:HUS1 checkpoint protein
VVTHLVAVRVLSVESIAAEREPSLPPEDVHILLPSSIDALRSVSERYKSLSDKLYVMANMAGELKLRVETEEVKVETRWTGLVNPPLGTSQNYTSYRLVY